MKFKSAALVAGLVLQSVFVSGAQAAEVSDSRGMTPVFVSRSFRFTLDECLAQLNTQAAAVTYSCTVAMPVPPRIAFPYQTGALYDNPPFSTVSASLPTTVSGVSGVANVKIYPTTESMVLVFQSATRNPATGGFYQLRRADVVNEITRIWNENSLSTRTWRIMIWLMS
ncbi:MAG: hypothetical protein KGQ59_02700 [Bdellovibrionales bacterium]|nr:hypothetical protein [Bdellovibrionales bacterium]